MGQRCCRFGMKEAGRTRDRKTRKLTHGSIALGIDLVFRLKQLLEPSNCAIYSTATACKACLPCIDPRFMVPNLCCGDGEPFNKSTPSVQLERLPIELLLPADLENVPFKSAIGLTYISQCHLPL